MPVRGNTQPVRGMTPVRGTPPMRGTTPVRGTKVQHLREVRNRSARGLDTCERLSGFVSCITFQRYQPVRGMQPVRDLCNILHQ